MRPGRYDRSPLAAIESALRPGDYIGELGVDLFVEPLEQVRARVLETPPTEAVDLFAAFVAGCLHKAGEVDDAHPGRGCESTTHTLGEGAKAPRTPWERVADAKPTGAGTLPAGSVEAPRGGPRFAPYGV